MTIPDLNLDELDIGGKKPFTFQFGGETWTCATPEEADIRTLGALVKAADEDPGEMLAWLLGEAQYARLDQIEAVFSPVHMRAVMEGWEAHHGMASGKSGGSSSSPKTGLHKRP